VTKRYACPCCGFLTLEEEPPGTFDICPVCNWEDDNVQFRYPTAGGANRVSLVEAKRNFVEFGASHRDCLARCRPPLREEMP
jgi:rubredoxin